MQIDISRLRAGSQSGDKGERSLDFSFAADMSDVRLWGEAPLPEPVRVEGVVALHADIVTVRYRAEYTLTGVCARCLSPVALARSEAFEHIVLEGGDIPEDKGDGFAAAPGGILDMDGLALDDVLLSQEGVTLCSPECRGLCPKCGVNLNEKTCSCVIKEPDSRFAVLLELLEKPGNSEK